MSRGRLTLARFQKVLAALAKVCAVIGAVYALGTNRANVYVQPLPNSDHAPCTLAPV